jgi:hypothetical protein
MTVSQSPFDSGVDAGDVASGAARIVVNTTPMRMSWIWMLVVVTAVARHGSPVATIVVVQCPNGGLMVVHPLNVTLVIVRMESVWLTSPVNVQFEHDDLVVEVWNRWLVGWLR